MKYGFVSQFAEGHGLSARISIEYSNPQPRFKAEDD